MTLPLWDVCQRGNDCEYRKVIMDFVDWCELNHLQVNASKTKEMVIDFSRKPSDIAPVNIQGLDIEREFVQSDSATRESPESPASCRPQSGPPDQFIQSGVSFLEVPPISVKEDRQPQNGKTLQALASFSTVFHLLLCCFLGLPVSAPEERHYHLFGYQCRGDMFRTHTMTTPKEVLLAALEDLGDEDFKKFKWLLQQPEVLDGFPAIPKSRLEKADRVDTVDQMVHTFSINTIKVTKKVLGKMNQNDLMKNLSDTTSEPTEILADCKRQVKLKLKKTFECVFEKITKKGNSRPLNDIYTELHIMLEESGEVNVEHEPHLGRDKPIRTVMTKGVAGIGKTVLTQKFTLDWAEDKANQDIHFTFPFTFTELNVLKEKKFSLVELVHHFFTETKEAEICRFEEFQVVFIFDGLDECRLPLDFHNNEILTDVTESTSVDVLLTNLIIRGKLLPSARLWITTRPAAANQIPPECVDMVTEVRGFTDPQKEEYFRKRFRDEEQASRIHLPTSRHHEASTSCATSQSSAGSLLQFWRMC
ncbi:hypothetical protein L3Q82_001567 [Scortum barcoo]|uniref:Uncharacterized protein n=1 Tax=Scortum barcoo TaxID=214431 RepID=A0ACB8W8K8_9TELE|nr:hypothetical protein L3Q82_001567 [Scortum barcoo]